MTASRKTSIPAFALPFALHTLLDAVFPQGGQRRARHNAWLAMCTDQVRAWERAEVQRALDPLTASGPTLHR